MTAAVWGISIVDISLCFFGPVIMALIVILIILDNRPRIFQFIEIPEDEMQYYYNEENQFGKGEFLKKS